MGLFSDWIVVVVLPTSTACPQASPPLVSDFIKCTKLMNDNDSDGKSDLIEEKEENSRFSILSLERMLV